MTYYNTTDFNNDNYSYSDENSSVASSAGLALKKQMDIMKRTDPGYFTVRRMRFNLKLNKMKGKKIELYRTSFSSNRKIRNAVTGFYENIYVGKLASNLLFKVILATGETGSNPEHLYFDSPEQYERHFDLIVSDNDKTEWTRKYNNEVDNQRRQAEEKRDKYQY